MPRPETIAEFHGGPFDGQRMEMKYQQKEFYADGDTNGKYVKTRVLAKDKKAYVWQWEA